MRIFDCFMFNNELELLELRLMELWETVDYFVLVEANTTHTGHPKPYHFAEHRASFRPYLDKIIHVTMDDLPAYQADAIWIAENYHRNGIARGLTEHARDGDKILVSDVDEIPNTDMIQQYRDARPWILFQQDLFYYYVNCRQNCHWKGPIMANYGSFDSPQQLRNVARNNRARWRARRNHAQIITIADGGWHYSFMGGAERIRLKIDSICEGPLIAREVGSVEEIAEKMRTQQDLWNRTDSSSQKTIVDIHAHQPKMLATFLQKYPHFFYTPAETV